MFIGFMVVIIVGCKIIIEFIRAALAATYVLTTKLGICLARSRMEFNEKKGLITSIVGAVTGFVKEFLRQVKTYYAADVCMKNDIDITAAMVELENRKSNIRSKVQNSNLW